MGVPKDELDWLVPRRFRNVSVNPDDYVEPAGLEQEDKDLFRRLILKTAQTIMTPTEVHGYGNEWDDFRSRGSDVTGDPRAWLT